MLDEAGFGKKVRGFPAAPMIWTLRLLERLQLSPLYKWVYETAGKDSFVSIEKAQRVLGFQPRCSNKRRPAAQLPLVPGAPGAVPGGSGSEPPGAVETGNPAAGESVLLTRMFRGREQTF